MFFAEGPFTVLGVDEVTPEHVPAVKVAAFWGRFVAVSERAEGIWV